MSEIKAALILEMIGRPVEHLKQVLENLINKMGDEKGVKITEKRVAEAKKIEKIKEEAYSIFAEIEIEIESLEQLFLIAFSYMPSHIEIISPQELKLKNTEVNSVVNQLILKLHKYDEIAKRIILERNIMQNQIMNLRQELESKQGKTKKAVKKKQRSKVTKKKTSKKNKK